jgi:hypothetical protein
MTATANHALQRTAPCVTAPASTAAFPPAMQVPRRTPRSLSLGSLGYFGKTSRRNEPLYPAGRTSHNLTNRTRNEELEKKAERRKAIGQKCQ